MFVGCIQGCCRMSHATYSHAPGRASFFDIVVAACAVAAFCVVAAFCAETRLKFGVRGFWSRGQLP